jgi:hypothetical protein
MRVRPAVAWFLVSTAVYAVLAGFVMWGAWSTDVAPVMPDCPVLHPRSWFPDFWARWVDDGRFTPLDATVFLGSPYFWQELKYVLGAWLSGLGLAYFLRGRGAPCFASYAAGLLLSLSGYWFTLFSAGHLGWFCWMAYGIFPFGLADRAVRKGKLKNWLLLGTLVGWACCWQTDLWLLFTALTGAYFVYACLRERRLPSWKGLLVSAVAFFAVGAAGIHHAFVNDLAGRERQIADDAAKGAPTAADDAAARADARWIFVTNWSLPPAETAEFFVSRLNGDTSCALTLSVGNRIGSGVRPYTGALGRAYGAERGNYRQHSLYVGLVTCLLALFALIHSFVDRRRASDVWFFAAAAAVCWLFSLGRHCPGVYRLVYALPFGDTLRGPVKWHHLTEFCLCVMAGLGLMRLWALAPRRGRWIRPVLAAVALAGAVDLAVVAKRYCAPVDIGEAKRQNCSMTYAYLRRGDFARPQIAARVKERRIVPVAQPAPDVYLVGVLEPWGAPARAGAWGRAAWLGVFSVLASVAACALAVSRRDRI